MFFFAKNTLKNKQSKYLGVSTNTTIGCCFDEKPSGPLCSSSRLSFSQKDKKKKKISFNVQALCCHLLVSFGLNGVRSARGLLTCRHFLGFRTDCTS